MAHIESHPNIVRELGNRCSNLAGKRVLVTGGCGFVGSFVTAQLLEVDARPRVFDLHPPREALAGAEYVQGNLLKQDNVEQALRNVDAVIHVAAPDPLHARKSLFQMVNVDGTKLLLDCCVKAGVKVFVLTSSASVLFCGEDALNLTDEAAKYPKDHRDEYARTKAIGEQMVLEYGEQTTHSMSTVALRPHGIFGPNCPAQQRMVEAGSKGKTRIMIGDNSNLVDWTYVENVAFSHLLGAAELMRDGRRSKLNARHYLITNCEPVPFWDMTAQLNRGLGFVHPWLNLPVALMMVVGTIMQFFADRIASFNPNFTARFIKYMTTHHYYSSKRAIDDFAYWPPVSYDDGLAKTIESFAEHKRAKPVAQWDFTSTAYQVGISGFVAAVTLTAFIGWLVDMDGWPGWSWASACGCYTSVRVVLATVVALAAAAYGRWSMWMWEPAFTFDGDVRVDLTGKKALVSGANKGIGFQVARMLALRGCHVILACRDAERARVALERLRKLVPHASAETASLDLASLKSVEELVARGADDTTAHALDFVVNNAAANVTGHKTDDGFDVGFQVNYLAHVLFSELLVAGKGKLTLAPHAKISNVSSVTHHMAVMDLQKDVFAYDGCADIYPLTKLLLIMYSFNLHHRKIAHATTQGIAAVHPGSCATDIFHQFLPGFLKPVASLVFAAFSSILRSDADGASAIMWSLLAPEVQQVSGFYSSNGKFRAASLQATDLDQQQALWERTQAWIFEWKKRQGRA